MGTSLQPLWLRAAIHLDLSSGSGTFGGTHLQYSCWENLLIHQKWLRLLSTHVHVPCKIILYVVPFTIIVVIDFFPIQFFLNLAWSLNVLELMVPLPGWFLHVNGSHSGGLENWDPNSTINCIWKWVILFVRATGLTKKITYTWGPTQHTEIQGQIVYRENEGQKIYITRFLFQL